MKYTRLTSFILFVPLFILFSCQNRKENTAKNANPVNETVRISNPPSSVSIHEAALNGQSSLVTAHIEAGTDVNQKDPEGRTPLMYASFNGHAEVIRALVKKGADINLQDIYGRSALMMASSGPYPVAVKLLLDHGANPNLIDREEHFTALMYAAAEGQLDVVKLLLANGADAKLKDVDGDNALTFAANNKHFEVVSTLESIKK
jgi:ankyrin repeat protein